MSGRQYAARDHVAQGDYYMRHLMAMTAEELHRKSAIAGELAHRDMEIDRLKAQTPPGYKLVLVPEGDAPDEPDWDECVRQAEVAIGIKVDRSTLSILVREVRRWLAQRGEQQAERMAASLFDHIAHGDAAHRAWLKDQALAWAKSYLQP